MSRWLELYATSPSGKTLFVCRMCGRISPVPDKECSVPPTVNSDKVSMPCSVLEEIEQALADVGETHIPRHTRMWIFKRGNESVVSWESTPGNIKSTEVKLREYKDKKKEQSLPNVMLRTPAGHINNCSLANGDDEKNCQICGGNCPDREMFR